MANDQNASQARRPHHHRRRGPERRGPDRASQGQQANGGSSREVDVEQIMRDIRARIATRHGIELTRAQVQELAARRLDAILEPRHIKPELMEQLRRAAGDPVQVPAAHVEPLPDLDESALYASHRGLLQLLRRWLRPVLKLFINPAPIVDAVNAGRRRAQAAATREAELHARQAQWNALHYEILQRLVTDVARATIETQSLLSRIESLAAKLDFSERRVGELEQILHSGKVAAPRLQEVRQPDAAAAEGAAAVPAEGTGEGSRRRRRRRRGRRSGLAAAEGGTGGADAERGDAEEIEIEGEEILEPADADQGLDMRAEQAADTRIEEATTIPLELERPHAFTGVEPVERQPQEEAPEAGGGPSASDESPAGSPNSDAQSRSFPPALQESGETDPRAAGMETESAHEPPPPPRDRDKRES